MDATRKISKDRQFGRVAQCGAGKVPP
ncbi:UNVERIFIED_ORG: hypothetical protein GGD58_003246 [Rhizobium pisi]